MPLLSRSKRKVGHALNSAAMHADAKQAQFCTYLSAILLVGLISNAVAVGFSFDNAEAWLKTVIGEIFNLVERPVAYAGMPGRGGLTLCSAIIA